MVDIALQIQLHFQRAVPVFKGEHGAPVQPEVAVEHLVVKDIGDTLVLQLLIGGEEQLHDLHCALIGDIELAVRMGVLAAVDGGAAQRIVGISLVEPIILVQHAHALGFDGGNGVEQIPHHLKMVIHLTAAAHHISDVFKFPAVAGAAGAVFLFQDVNVLALHLAVANQIAGGRQRGKAAANDISRLVIYPLGLTGTGKGFIITAGIIHNG